MVCSSAFSASGAESMSGGLPALRREERRPIDADRACRPCTYGAGDVGRQVQPRRTADHFEPCARRDDLDVGARVIGPRIEVDAHARRARTAARSSRHISIGASTLQAVPSCAARSRRSRSGRRRFRSRCAGRWCCGRSRPSRCQSSTGLNAQVPPRSWSSSRANTDGLSKRGRHSQSMLVSGPTRARTRPLPIAP